MRNWSQIRFSSFPAVNWSTGSQWVPVGLGLAGFQSSQQGRRLLPRQRAAVSTRGSALLGLIYAQVVTLPLAAASSLLACVCVCVCCLQVECGGGQAQMGSKRRLTLPLR